jgi:RNA polymerase sigma-70 factor (ECF subfamily)
MDRKDPGLRNLDERELISAAIAGCTDSFGELVARQRPGLVRYLQRRTASVEDAEDITQETFVRAYLKLGQFNSQWRFSTWLFTIAKKLAINYYRRQQVAPAWYMPRSAVERPDDRLVSNEESMNLWSAARSLPASQYEAMWLRYSEGMSVEQIARLMKKSKVCARVLLYRGRVNLARQLRGVNVEKTATGDGTRAQRSIAKGLSV